MVPYNRVKEQVYNKANMHAKKPNTYTVVHLQ